jgi:hypothetical protein
MPGGKQVVDADMWQLHLSARVWHRVLKISRTITDREGVDLIVTPHLAEARKHGQREGNQEQDSIPRSLPLREEASGVPRNSAQCRPYPQRFL